MIRRDASNRDKDRERAKEEPSYEAKVLERSSFVGAGSADCGAQIRGKLAGFRLPWLPRDSLDYWGNSISRIRGHRNRRARARVVRFQILDTRAGRAFDGFHFLPEIAKQFSG